jgi:hypothetical protein
MALIAVPLLSILVLQGLQWYARHEAKERMEREAMVTVTIPAGDLHWHKRGKELVIDGKLFDVKTLRQTGGQIILTGLFDEAETAIVDLLEQQAGHSKQSSGITYLFVFLLQFVAIQGVLTFISYRGAQPAACAKPLPFYISPFLGIVAPPPRG